ncbi:carbohydrate ABC transporter permease [Agromyces silvae]|uniref:carbohydrate ABC transporter permease n=1 Tax=Agromyces silvae TaxID=3388266 RepID=UPI00280BA7C5|nr:carbohydrate ABC transporter permease [Agromyces protaetiae]
MRDRRSEALGTLTLVALMLAMVLPFLAMLVTALHPQGRTPAGLTWPADPQWGNFAIAFEATDFLTLAQSSVLIVLGVVPAALAFATFAGFALGHLRPWGRRAIFVAFLLGLTIPFESAVIPLYYQARDLGTLNTQWAIILPLIGLAMPFGVFWMTGHFRSIPAEISEAARMDGANAWQLFRHVHLPLAVPALVTLGLLQFLNTWNHFILAVVLIDDPSRRTMAGALGAFQGQYRTDLALLCAGAILLMVPTLLVFLVLQRHFVKAVLAGAVKG